MAMSDYLSLAREHIDPGVFSYVRSDVSDVLDPLVQ
jgi:hypothetical protein